MASLAALSLPAVAADETIIAKVNGRDIVEADLALAEAEIGGELGNLPQNVKRRVLVEYMIDNQLFAEAAETDKLATGADFERRLAYWRQRALRDIYFEKSVRGSISEAVARGIYDDKVKGLKTDEEVQARHILVKSEDAAKALVVEIGKGADFADLAKKNSEDPGSKEQGGMLGYFGRGQMVPAFEDAAFSLQKGEVSKPVQSQFGWHIIKVEDRRQKPPPSFEEVKDRLIGSMVQNKAQDIATGLRSKAQITYVDAEIKKLADEDAAKRAIAEEAFKNQTEGAPGSPVPATPAPQPTPTPTPTP
ncbi:MAG: peptidylprolyl isomerase [Hyphomicrobium sp.]|nr:peptidylprolyl isomerase [Hyphomicrobium sp.]